MQILKKKVSSKIDQIGQDEYESIFYLDAVLDEDYFGEGVCRWQTYGFGLAFQATGKPEETFFNFGYDIDNGVIEKKTLTRYYQKRGYPYYKNEDGLPYGSKDSPDIDFGRDAITDYSPELRNNLFSVTVKWSRVVASSNHNTCKTVEVTNCKRKFRSWTKAFENV